ncbi:DNA-binding protein EMBP-1-like isoform X2 [Phragmites australis]|uniref:DNA-binding protein EMBP-1-like isoform X2 n=1 Tax=Phragmites australis TaxID=29695 RepID=UPI002D792CCA|nr:DNA-binding protein EMBP-1-like isoform X2 [Phragmites australis]
MASSTSTASGDEPRGPSSGAGAPLQALAEWAASLQAYYAAGGHPYAWPAAQQHMMAAAAAGAPYAAPVPFPMYHPAVPAYYAHASMVAGVPYPAGEAAPEAEGNRKMKSSGGPYGDGSSGSSDGGSEESSDKRDASADQKVSPSAKRRKSSNANVEGGPSQPATTQDAAAESPFATKRRSASQLSVSTLERAALSNPTTNLNIGMDIWSNSPTKAETLGQGEMNAGAPSQHAGALSQMDKRDLKRERRKKSNRESARKSRLRKQQECEELAQKVTDLTEINGALRSELDQLKKACEGMEAENSQLMDEMEQSEAPGVLTTLSMQIDTSKVHANNGQRHKKNNNDSKW